MNHCDRETEFLNQMLVTADNGQYRELQVQLAQTQRALRCIRRAARRVVMLMLLCVAGIGYSAVFLPEFVEGRPHFLINLFSTIILACLICLSAYCATWLWHSRIATRIHVTCRKALLGREQARTDLDAISSRTIRFQDSESLNLDRSGRGLRPAPDENPTLKAP
jgi:hypothetical protein